MVLAGKLFGKNMTKVYASTIATCYAVTTQFAQSPDETSHRFPKKTEANPPPNEAEMLAKRRSFPQLESRFVATSKQM
ncbi:MAG: hypothetical protein CBE00_04060 [Planctomycetaceae bacterium TMED240]|nr:MAG: hypothetical protein CBE00_04060 [Planctomycetaceae bacterium TMED240]